MMISILWIIVDDGEYGEPEFVIPLMYRRRCSCVTPGSILAVQYKYLNLNTPLSFINL
jgi:hypothetical protein